MHRSKYDGFFKKDEKFGDWEVVNPNIFMDGRGRAYVFCKCTSCENETRNVACHHLVRGRTQKCNYCANSYKLRGFDRNPNWQGKGEVPKSILTRISSSAAHKGIPYNLTTTYANDLYSSSNKTCTYTGYHLSVYDNSAALTCIDNSRGYLEGNVVWANNTVAAMKSKCQSKDEFINICLAVAKQHQFKNSQQMGGSNESQESKESTED